MVKQLPVPCKALQQLENLNEAPENPININSRPRVQAPTFIGSSGPDNLTAFVATGVLEGGRHPAWGSQTEHTAVQPAMQLEASPDGQLGKWGFVPGAEDTMDLNLEDKGQQLCQY